MTKLRITELYWVMDHPEKKRGYPVFVLEDGSSHALMLGDGRKCSWPSLTEFVGEPQSHPKPKTLFQKLFGSSTPRKTT